MLNSETSHVSSSASVDQAHRQIHLPIHPPAGPVVARCQEVFEPALLTGWGGGGGVVEWPFPNPPEESGRKKKKIHINVSADICVEGGVMGNWEHDVHMSPSSTVHVKQADWLRLFGKR